MTSRIVIFGLTCLTATSAWANGNSFFSETVYPVLQKANCRTCHVDNGIASATRLHFPELSASRLEIEAFGKELAALINRAEPSKSLLLVKPTSREKHTGGKLISPGSKEEAVLIEWIDRLSKLPAENAARPAAEQKADAATVVRRLTHSQYNNTARDLLKDETKPANQFPQEDFVNGFKNQVEAQGVPALLAEAYSAAAEKLARNAFRGGDTNGLIPCRPHSADDAECRANFIKRFGFRAFRRPLTGNEVARYIALFAGEAKRKGRFLDGAQLAVEAMLQSPAFLFHTEQGPYEAASRLSYALWDSMPDDKLFQSAAAGELSTPIGLEKAARRMLEDRRARQALDEFVSQWLRFDRLLGTVKDHRLFPQFTPELAVSMTEESRRLISDAIWNDRNFMNILTADYSFLSSDLAALYKLPAPANESDRVSLPAESERAGILGQAAFLALTSKPGDTSPTARGLFVRGQLLCQHVPDPPPGTNSNLPPVTEAKPQTNRERLSIHLVKENCAGCHKLMDPIGFGFEKFDAVGAHRDKLTITFFPDRHKRDTEPPKTVDLVLDTKGSIAGIANSDFASPRELGKVLADSAECQQCMVKQLFRYIYGRQEKAADRPVIQRALARFRDSGFHFKELLIALSSSYAPPGG